MYAESSAVLAWLLDQDGCDKVAKILDSADAIVASDLTLIECDRVLHRLVSLEELTEADAADRRAYLARAASSWHVLRIESGVVTRARQAFPVEPIRSLDAIHLASALIARSAVAGLEMLTLDDRVMKAAGRLGMRCVPEPA